MSELSPQSWDEVRREQVQKLIKDAIEEMNKPQWLLRWSSGGLSLDDFGATAFVHGPERSELDRGPHQSTDAADGGAVPGEGEA